MDPVTHALIGMAVSAVGQDSFSLVNPVTVSAVAGALIPDGDIILRLKGESYYLKHHRGVSHSLPGIIVQAVGIGLILKIFYHQAMITDLILWALIGAFTHIASDVLNSYGAKVLWPISNRKRSLSLLTLTDPVVLIMLIGSISTSYYKLGYNKYIIADFGLYIISKVVMRVYGVQLLKKHLGSKYNIQRIHLLPSMIANYKFQYIVEDQLHKIVGEINFISNKVRIFNVFKRVDRVIKEFVLKSDVAVYFREFTPISHIAFERLNDGYRVLLTDLRYMFNNRFLHHATIIYDEQMNVIEEKFNPYSMKNKIDI